jgi:hypothetical protein
MAAQPHDLRPPHQFSVAALFEYTTICGVAAALAPVIGSASSGLLMAAAVALGARRGGLALAAILMAMLAADYGLEAAAANSLLRQLVIAVLAAALSAWYRLRRASGAAGRTQSQPGQAPTRPVRSTLPRRAST